MTADTRPRVREVEAKSILSASKIPGVDWCLNPYTGCSHGCVYCYVRIMQRFFGHQGERWGSFVDAKCNAPHLLLREVVRKKRGRVMLSSVTDCYQPLEAKMKLTRACLEVLADARAPVSILTKSALVLRDIPLLQRIDDLSVGLTIATDDDRVRRAMEPGASAIAERLRAARELAAAGLEPYVFVGPALPMSPERLAAALSPHVSRVLFDRMNYPRLASTLLRRNGWEMVLDPAYVEQVLETFRRVLGPERVEAVC